MQPPSGSVPTLPMPPFLTSVSPTSTVHGIKANWADFFWFIFWLQASLHQQLLNVLISLFKLSQAVQAKQKKACLLAGFCQVFASPVYYIVRWSKSMQYEGTKLNPNISPKCKTKLKSSLRINIFEWNQSGNVYNHKYIQMRCMM